MGLEVKDGVIAGDVHTGDVHHHHHHHVSARPQLAAPPQPPEVVIVQKSGPSSAAPIMGVLCTIYGVINALIAIPMFILLNETADGSQAFMVTLVGTTISLGAVVVGGVMIAQYRRLGIYLIWIGFVVVTVLDMIAFEVDGGRIVQDFLGGPSVSIINAVSSLVCGLIIAIPLFIPNNGMK